MRLFYKYGNGMGYSIFVGSAGQGQLTAVIWSNSKFYRINTASAYNDNQWHNVVMARDGSNLEMYIDGQLENIIPATSEDLSNSNPYPLEQILSTFHVFILRVQLMMCAFTTAPLTMKKSKPFTTKTAGRIDFNLKALEFIDDKKDIV